MKNSEKFILFSAESTHKIIAFEKLLLENNIQCRIIPLPTEISANCGLSIKIEEKNLEQAKSLACSKDFNLNINIVEKQGLKKIFTNIS